MTDKIVRQIGHACILARDLGETEQFYTRVLGFSKIFNFTRDGQIVGYYLDAGGDTHIEVFERKDADKAGAAPIDHLCFEVIDMDEAIAHCRALGIAASDKTIGCDDTWQAWVTDPNGVKIEFFQYTGKSAQFTGGDREVTW